MTESPRAQAPSSGRETTIDPMVLRRAMERLRSEQNLALGLIGGTAAAAVGAVLWAGLTVATNYQIGWMAIGIGFLVGYAIRYLGKGIDPIFGIIGSVESLVGCAAGNLFAVCALVAMQENIPFLDILSRLNPAAIGRLMSATFSPMDLLFYGLALYTGYKLSFRNLTEEELRRLLPA